MIQDNKGYVPFPKQPTYTHCFCGNEITKTTQEVSRSMYYVNRRTCSNKCHNEWILGIGEHHADKGHPVGKGWMPLVEKLHADISALDPDYHLVQIKEKFGGLRYYIDHTEPIIPTLQLSFEEYLAISRAQNDAAWAVRNHHEREDEEYKLEEWKLKSLTEIRDNLLTIKDRFRPIDKLIKDAETASYRTCELCGEVGELDKTNGWLLTLCSTHTKARSEGVDIWNME